LIYAGLGDNDQAMTWLNKAHEARFNPSICCARLSKRCAPNPRFQNLLRRIGLPR
jgi:hypothetical protein